MSLAAYSSEKNSDLGLFVRIQGHWIVYNEDIVFIPFVCTLYKSIVWFRELERREKNMIKW